MRELSMAMVRSWVRLLPRERQRRRRGLFLGGRKLAVPEWAVNLGLHPEVDKRARACEHLKHGGHKPHGTDSDFEAREQGGARAMGERGQGRAVAGNGSRAAGSQVQGCRK